MGYARRRHHDVLPVPSLRPAVAELADDKVEHRQR
jgi:hypothetical protein